MNIRRIASLAGVSIATVSRAVNSPDSVHVQTRERILQIMQQEGYAPARSFAAQGALLFLYDAQDHSFYEPIIDGFHNALLQTKLSVLFLPLAANESHRRAQFARMNLQKLCGVIWALRDFYPEETERFAKRGLPLVLMRKYDHAPKSLPCCYADFATGAFRMTEHLLRQGRRHIALLVEKVSFQFVSSFCGGWKRAYFENGLPFDESWIIHTPNTVEGGYAAARALLLGPDAPDAFFCASNEMAFGALRAAHELQIPVPERLAIAGFTDSPIAMLSDPPLTALSQPIYQLGVTAVRLLLDIIEHHAADGSAHAQEVMLPPQLCIRASSDIGE